MPTFTASRKMAPFIPRHRSSRQRRPPGRFRRHRRAFQPVSDIFSASDARVATRAGTAIVVEPRFRQRPCRNIDRRLRVGSLPDGSRPCCAVKVLDSIETRSLSPGPGLRVYGSPEPRTPRYPRRFSWRFDPIAPRSGRLADPALSANRVDRAASCRASNAPRPGSIRRSQPGRSARMRPGTIGVRRPVDRVWAECA